MESRADSVEVAQETHQSRSGGSNPTSALSIVVKPISFQEAVKYNEQWHSRLPLLKTGFIKNMPFPSFAGYLNDECVAVAIWSNPVSAALPQHEWLELRRFAISPNAPKNTASRMLSVMVRLLKRSRPKVVKFISYQDMEVHTGAIYKAAGWTATNVHKGGSWSRPNAKNKNGKPRTRPDLNKATGPKQRWELDAQK